MHVVAGGIVGSVADQCNKANMALRQVRNFFFFWSSKGLMSPAQSHQWEAFFFPSSFFFFSFFTLGFLTLPEALLCGSEPGCGAGSSGGRRGERVPPVSPRPAFRAGTPPSLGAPGTRYRGGSLLPSPHFPNRWSCCWNLRRSLGRGHGRGDASWEAHQ